MFSFTILCYDHPMNIQILSALNWRYATKLFNTEKIVSEEDLNTLLEAARLAPTSQGLQPWKAFVITNKEIREKLKIAAYNQPQLTSASHIIVFASRKTLDEKYIESYLNIVRRIRNQKEEDVAGYKKMLMGSIAGKTQQEMQAWNGRQTYIALGFLLETAAIMNIDACPMEGFDTAKFDSILELEKTDYASVVMVAIGYRAEEDKYARAAKVRRSTEDLFIKI